MPASREKRAPLSVSGTVQVFCVHRQEKRSRTVMEFDSAEFNPNVCICCENMILVPISEPIGIYCNECNPTNWEKK